MPNTETNPAILNAARRLVRGFSMIPSDWLSAVTSRIADEEYVSMPVHGTMFVVEDSCDARSISALLVSMGAPEDDKVDQIIEWAEGEGLEIDDELRLLALAASDEHDVIDELDHLRNELMEQWRDGGSEDAIMCMDGWEAVGTTGLLAREFDGRLVLGINGGGYDFYESHWIPLYLALGYQWHDTAQDERRKEGMARLNAYADRIIGCIELREILSLLEN
jgi:hypothetical protein